MLLVILIMGPFLLVQSTLLLSKLMNDLLPMVSCAIATTLFAAWFFTQWLRWKKLMRKLEGWCCPTCSYDLTFFRGQDGGPNRGICPECGGEFSVEDNQKLYNIKVQEHLGNKKT